MLEGTEHGQGFAVLQSSVDPRPARAGVTIVDLET